MNSRLCEKLGIEFPLFAFSHCRNVVTEVSKAGGFGVFGAVGLTPESLEIELKWIDENIDGTIKIEKTNIVKCLKNKKLCLDRPARHGPLRVSKCGADFRYKTIHTGQGG